MSKKRVFIGVGHGGSDPGAQSNGLVESKLNLVMALECNRVLVEHGVEVLMSRYKDENDDIAEEVRECNSFKPDLAIDIHNNSGGGDGFEIFHSRLGGVGKQLAHKIEKEVLAIGQNSRGCKVKLNKTGRDYFKFIRETNCPAVIAEGCFLDSKDRLIADTLDEQKKFGLAYAKGILKQLNITYKAPSKPNNSKPQTSTKGTVYQVVIGSFKEKKNAEECLNKAKKAGFKDSFIDVEKR